MFRLFGFIALLLVLPACTSTINAHTVRYHRPHDIQPGMSFAVVAEDSQWNDLEFRHYANMVSSRLQQLGLPQAESLHTADFHAFLHYGIDNTSQQIITHNTGPRVYGGVSSYHGRRGSGLGVGLGMPLYGDPYGYSSRSYVLSNPYFELRLVRSGRQKATSYQGRAVIRGTSASLTNAVPCLITALLRDFPGADGVEQQVRLHPSECGT